MVTAGCGHVWWAAAGRPQWRVGGPWRVRHAACGTRRAARGVPQRARMWHYTAGVNLCAVGGACDVVTEARCGVTTVVRTRARALPCVDSTHVTCHHPAVWHGVLHSVWCGYEGVCACGVVMVVALVRTWAHAQCAWACHDMVGVALCAVGTERDAVTEAWPKLGCVPELPAIACAAPHPRWGGVFVAPGGGKWAGGACVGAGGSHGDCWGGGLAHGVAVEKRVGGLAHGVAAEKRVCM